MIADIDKDGVPKAPPRLTSALCPRPWPPHRPAPTRSLTHQLTADRARICAPSRHVCTPGMPFSKQDLPGCVSDTEPSPL